MVYLLIVLATITRFIPHTWNFSPVYGALLFGGAKMKKRDALWFPALVLGTSDVILTRFVYDFRVGWGELFQIAAFVSIAMMGWTFARRCTLGRLAVACVAGPTAFHLISNFGVWLEFHTYPASWGGLVACYVAAIPFFGRTFASTVLFAGMLFGVQHYCSSRASNVAQRRLCTAEHAENCH